jgi:3-hydroxyisobutyrate dehydrogenase-like beta-hydroxyacid dehydrogenase
MAPRQSQSGERREPRRRQPNINVTIMNILWIGYGKMGEPMAARAAAAGHTVQVSDMSRERCDAARANDLEVVAITPESAGQADVILTSLPNDAAALQLLAGVTSALSHVRAGALLIETSTISASASASIANIAQARGIGYVRGPVSVSVSVSGSVTAAANGALTTFLSGAHDAIEQARPIVGAYASNLVVVGDAEQARTMKLAINLMVTTLVASLCEAYTLCTKGCIEAGTACVTRPKHSSAATSRRRSPWRRCARTFS